ncbi:MAG TPA: HAMP domain-containing sensor histidine kinase [Bacteroidota bacterium]
MSKKNSTHKPQTWTGRTGDFKVLLLAIASTIVIGMLVYSQHVTDRLLQKQREIVDLYARSYEYIARDNSSGGDYSFLFDEIIRTIDFPIILTDAANTPHYWRNIKIDTVKLAPMEQVEFVSGLMRKMDERNTPIKIALNDSLILNYVHYGESDLIVQLRWLPFIEISLATIFIFSAYIGFSYIKRTEQSNIWVGMSKETAHQLGTPLSSLMGWVELLRIDAGTNPKLESTIDEMSSDVERLNKVAERFSKIGSRPDLKKENVREVISSVVAYFSRRLPRSGRTVDIVFENEEEVYAEVNRELFEWVLENLMKNAVDAMDGTSGRISFHLSQSGSHAIIDVTDSGKGIDPRLHKDVFRPGYSTKKRGWGLGLSLSKRIIEEYHRGKLSVKKSAVGEGTTFRIRLKT